ncbi:phosphatidylinositol-specific phospholipase C domain-containing protein [Kitasatospora sp. NPDC048296]|uniref:phosphatidylinositol-specific phospholipase C domain-containing protein n=1 Tax=Kitasatospora sp. NPDC048296 TaxID=3364048 RepID=UPI003719E390
MSSPTRRDVLRWGAVALPAVGGLLRPVTARAATAVDPSAWMAALADTTPLTALTIPGTHDSCCTDPWHGTEWSHTQNWGLPEQLQRGIRFLDIRCNGLAGTADELGIYHSDAYQYLRLQDVLDQCRDFLATCPGEAVVMRVRNEYAGGNRLEAPEFQRRINHYLDDLGYRPLFWTDPWWPTLGQARGRIVLAADFANPWSVIQWSSATNPWFATQDTFQGISLAPGRHRLVRPRLRRPGLPADVRQLHQLRQRRLAQGQRRRHPPTRPRLPRRPPPTARPPRHRPDGLPGLPHRRAATPPRQELHRPLTVRVVASGACPLPRS